MAVELLGHRVPLARTEPPELMGMKISEDLVAARVDQIRTRLDVSEELEVFAVVAEEQEELARMPRLLAV